ncbi:MAG: LacI family DNA-binding transcriptional regulator [Victivallales bacterium]
MITDNKIFKLEWSGNSPRYEQLRKHYAELIENETIAGGEKIPSVYDLAKITGVSNITIRRVFKELTDTGYLESRSTGTYVSDKYLFSHFKPLKRKNNIGILFPTQLDHTNKLEQRNSPWTWEILSVIQRILSQDGYICSLLTVNSDDVKKGIDPSDFASMAGYISFPDNINGEVMHFLDNLGKPFVMIDRWNKEITRNYISCDYIDQGRKAAEILTASGFKRFITMDDRGFLSYASYEKQKGFVETLLKHHFKLADVTVIPQIADYQDEKITELIKRNGKSGIFVLNDFIGVNMYYLVLKHGINIPDNVAIIGSSGGEIRKLSNVQLSTVRQPVEDIGKTAANMIVKMITEKIEYFEGIKLPACFMEGSTTPLRSYKRQLKQGAEIEYAETR